MIVRSISVHPDILLTNHLAATYKEDARYPNTIRTIIMTAGATPGDDREEHSCGLVSEIYGIGDAAKPGKIIAAVKKELKLPFPYGIEFLL